MPELPAHPPVRPPLTPAARERWRAQASAALKRDEPAAAVDAWLQQQGCPPRLRQELLARATARSLGKHRLDGLRLIAAERG